MKLIVGTKAFPITRARAVRSSVPVLKDDKRKIAFLELELLSLLELFLLLCCDCYPSFFKILLCILLAQAWSIFLAYNHYFSIIIAFIHTISNKNTTANDYIRICTIIYYITVLLCSLVRYTYFKQLKKQWLSLKSWIFTFITQSTNSLYSLLHKLLMQSNHLASYKHTLPRLQD